MTFHKGVAGVSIPRVTCDHFTWAQRDGLPGLENLIKKPCPAEITGRPTATSLRWLAGDQGWQRKRALGTDLCPQHKVGYRSPWPYVHGR